MDASPDISEMVREKLIRSRLKEAIESRTGQRVDEKMLDELLLTDSPSLPISFLQKREEADEVIHQTVVINGLSEHGGVNYIL